MKKLLALFLLIVVSVMTTTAQDRTNATKRQLSWKSKEITSAHYFNYNYKTGKWESHKNASPSYTNNFNKIFIGEYNGDKYLFLDYWEIGWKYPEIKEGRFYHKRIYQGLLTKKDFEALKNLEFGDIYVFQANIWGTLRKSKQINRLENDFGRDYVWASTSKESREYSPSSLLYITERAPFIREGVQLIVVKRTLSNGQDVIRFRTYPNANKYSIDSAYFEISYDYFQRLFTPSKSVKFK